MCPPFFGNPTAAHLDSQSAALQWLSLDPCWLNGRSARHQPNARLGWYQPHSNGVNRLSVSPAHVEELEQWIDGHDTALEPLKNFILPGGTPAAAAAHLARTVCRRAERCIVALSAHDDVGEVVVRYVNRLSDYLFIAARRINSELGVGDVMWTNPASS